MVFSAQLPQHSSTLRPQEQTPACPQQPSSTPLPVLRSQPQRSCGSSLSDRQRRQQLRRLRRVVLQAVRADQQGQQTDSGTLQLISEITSRVDEAHNDLLQSSSRSDGYVDPGAESELKSKVYKSIESLSQGLLERETEVSLLSTLKHYSASAAIGKAILLCPACKAHCHVPARCNAVHLIAEDNAWNNDAEWQQHV